MSSDRGIYGKLFYGLSFGAWGHLKKVTAYGQNTVCHIIKLKWLDAATGIEPFR